MANEQNLKPFKPGQSGNPNGKPKGTLSAKTILKKLLSAKVDIEDEDGNKTKSTQYEKILFNLIKLADGGNRKAINDILDRYEGKPGQSIEVKEKTIDDLESLSEEQLKDRANAIIEKLKYDSASPRTSEN